MYQIFLKYMKDVFTTKCRPTLIICYLNINVDFAKDLTLSREHDRKMERKWIMAERFAFL